MSWDGRLAFILFIVFPAIVALAILVGVFFFGRWTA
jgi:hypothetical protein